MIYIEIKDEKGGLEKALKKFKTKFKQTKVVEELRQRQAFEKPSVTRRKEVIKAKYRQSNQTQD
jgi:small subunit ribosomal protein S21